ncbi:hypothetical protein PIROE2DRAFT_9331 [Piromyces sp. E2]|nr:hypothetical protein PIROE2DRAFT_9331 [Piromyces sp. E2]|eukprot:OUM64024.1 hypothetical protein PIROE2DRAFT_9331 [Piromyces sp. E2]
MLIHSVYFDNIENELSIIENYKEIHVSNFTNLLNTNKDEIVDLINHILNTVINNNLNEYCSKRPYVTESRFRNFEFLYGRKDLCPLSVTLSELPKENDESDFKYNVRRFIRHQEWVK